MTMLLYSALLTFGLLLSAPWWLLRMATTERYREGLRGRLGLVPAGLRDTVAGRRIVWLHAVSVGEVLAATRLAAELEAALGDGWGVVLSTTTRTGQALAKQRFGDARVFYMPLDFAFAVRAYLRVLEPAALILMESELWPRLLHECSTRNIPVAVANARVSDRSFARAMKVRAVWKHLVRKPTLWLAQSEEDALRLMVLGARPETIQTSGNLKYDIRAPEHSRIAELIQEAAGGRSIIVAGSTLGEDPPEDSPLIRVQQSIPPEQRPVLVLAPRHPEAFGCIYSMAIEYPTLLASELIAGKDKSQDFSVLLREGERACVEIIVLDTIGDLASVYSVADIAFIGGSLIRRGGHNPLEPAQFGVPIIMGPSFENFRDIVLKMIAAHAICIVGDPEIPETREARHESPMSQACAPSGAKAPVFAGIFTAGLKPRPFKAGPVQKFPGAKPKIHKDSVKDGGFYFALSATLNDLLEHPAEAKAMGQRGRAVFESQQGATARTVAAILSMMHEAKP